MKKFNETTVEHVWFMYGLRIGSRCIGFLKYHNSGSTASVTFNWSKAFYGWFGKKASRFLVGFYHNHPKGYREFSTTDSETMDSWVKAMGRPMFCVVRESGVNYFYLFSRLTENFKDPQSAIVIGFRVRSVVKGPFFVSWYE